MKKEFIKIFVAVVVLFAIAIPLSLYRGKKMKENIAKDDDQKFIAFDISKINRLKILNQTSSIDIERRQKDSNGRYKDEFEFRTSEFVRSPNWIITQPFRALVDEMKIGSFFDQIKNISYQKIIQDDQTRSSEYDLKPAKLSVSFFEGGQKDPKLTVDMGSANPSNSGYYFSSSTKPGIYLGDRALQPYIDQDLNDWREHKIIEFKNPDQVERIAIQYPGIEADSFTISKEKNGWLLVEPKKPVAIDQKEIADFIDHLNDMHSAKIFDESPLNKDTKKIAQIIVEANGEKIPYQFDIYNGGKDKKIYFVKRSGMKETFQIASDDKKLLRNLQTILDKHTLSKSLNDMVSMRIFKTGEALELVNEGNIWKVKKPYEDQASVKRLDSLVTTLKDFQGTKYLTTKVLNDKDRLIRIEFGLKDGSVSSTSFYKEGKQVYAKVEDATIVRVLEVTKIPAEIDEHVSHIRSDELLSIPTDQLKTIAFSKGNVKVEIENGASEVWHVKTIENASPTLGMKWKEQLTSQELFNRVSEMYLHDFISKPDTEEKFDTASLTITSATGEQVHWNFGQKKGEMIDVYSPERKVVGRMPWTRYQDLAIFLDEPLKTAK